MATAKTDLESLQKTNEDLQAEVEKLRQQALSEEQSLLLKQQQDSVAVDNAALEQERDRLKQRLEAAKDAAKVYAEANTPLEQAEIANAPVPAPTTEKKE